MDVKKSVRDYTLVTGTVNLPRRLVVGARLEYKYKVVTPAGKHWEKLTITGERVVINRVLQGKNIIVKLTIFSL